MGGAVLFLVHAALAAIGMNLRLNQSKHAGDFMNEAESVGVRAIPGFDEASPCNYWHGVWAKSRRTVRYVEFVHVPKAGGHYVEEWLMHAYHGNQSAHAIGPAERQLAHDKCTKDTRDCHTFHGGHHSYTQRIVRYVDPTTGDGEFGQYFVTTARETIARLVSHYNDVTLFLSVVRCTEGGTMYCGPTFQSWCKSGTGFNFITMRTLAARGLPNATSPCEPRMTFVEFALRFSMTNEQSRYILPLNRAHWRENRTQAANAMRALLRRAYLQMGTVSSEATLRDFVTRLRYSLDTPWRPSTARQGTSSAEAAASPSQLTSRLGHEPRVTPAPAPAMQKPSQKPPHTAANVTANEEARMRVHALFDKARAAIAEYLNINPSHNTTTSVDATALVPFMEQMRSSLENSDKGKGAAPTTARQGARSPGFAHATAPGAPPGMQRPKVVASKDDLSPSAREEILKKHWSDVILYNVTLEIEREQQRCYESLAEELREPAVQTTKHGHAVISSAWWLPASQIDGVKRPLHAVDAS